MDEHVWIKDILLCKITLSLRDKYILVCSKDIYDNLYHNNKVGKLFYYRVSPKKYMLLGRLIAFGNKNKLIVLKLNNEIIGSKKTLEKIDL